MRELPGDDAGAVVQGNVQPETFIIRTRAVDHRKRSDDGVSAVQGDRDGLVRSAFGPVAGGPL